MMEKKKRPVTTRAKRKPESSFQSPPALRKHEAEAMDLRMRGYGYSQIAEKLGMTRESATSIAFAGYQRQREWMQSVFNVVAIDAYHQLDIIRDKLMEIANGAKATTHTQMKALEAAANTINSQVGLFARFVPQRHEHEHHVTTHSVDDLLAEADRLMARRDEELGIRDVTPKTTETDTKTETSGATLEKPHGEKRPKTPRQKTV